MCRAFNIYLYFTYNSCEQTVFYDLFYLVFFRTGPNQCVLAARHKGANFQTHCYENKPVGDVVRSLLTIGNALFSPLFLQSCYVIHESGSDNPFQRYGHSKFSKMAAGRHLRFGATESRSIRFAVPENPTLGSNTKSIG